MRSICTEFRDENPALPLRFVRRGNAEIETLLVIMMVLLPMLLVTLYAGKIGLHRLQNVFAAENGAYTQIETGAGLAATSDPVPVDAPNQPALPTRFAVADQTQTLNPNRTMNGVTLNPVNLEDQAFFLDPSWHWDPTPEAADQQTLGAWFDAYVAESHPAELDSALGIQPPGPP